MKDCKILHVFTPTDVDDLEYSLATWEIRNIERIQAIDKHQLFSDYPWIATAAYVAAGAAVAVDVETEMNTKGKQSSARVWVAVFLTIPNKAEKQSRSIFSHECKRDKINKRKEFAI